MELGEGLRALAALAAVLALIVGIGWLARRFTPGAALRVSPRDKRLGVVEVLSLDPRRRLVLVRRDGVEHLLLLGAASESVVETGIAARVETQT